LGITIVLVALIIGFMVVTVFSLTAMLVVRRREKERDDSYKIAKTVEELDTALNAALTEINRMGALIQADVDEKYKSVLFLYNLVEDKQKEIAESADGEVISEMMAQYIEEHGDKLRQLAKPSELGHSEVINSEVTNSEIRLSEPAQTEPAPQVFENFQEKTEPENKKPQKFANAKHKQIWEMRDSGQAVSDIAKTLDMGQGEVKLILDLIERAS